MEEDRHGNIIRPFTNDRKEAVLAFRDSGHFNRSGKVGRSNWRHDLYRFLQARGDTEVTYFNLICWIRPNYGLIDEGNWTWCMPNLAEDFLHFFDGADEAIQNPNCQIVVAQEEGRPLAAIYRAPPEMWAVIFDQLKNPMDVLSAYQAYPFWGEILQPAKSTWLLYFVLDHLMGYLSKEDLLLCRLVCQRWCISVDHFLQNNFTQRPTFEDHRMKTFTGEIHPRTDRCDNPRTWNFLEERFSGLQICPGIMEALLNQGVDIHRCPAVGKCGCLEENGDTYQFWQPIKLRFLAEFGHHFTIIFLRLTDMTPLDTVSCTAQLLSNVPNLIRLEMTNEDITIPAAVPIEEIQQQLSEYRRNEISYETIERFPRLESLFLSVEFQDEADIIQKALLDIVRTDRLEYLRVDSLPSNIQINTLLWLECHILVDEHIGNLRQVDSPLRKLSLCFNFGVNSHLLFEAIQTFGTTLRNLHISCSPYPEEDNAQNLLPYFEVNALDNMLTIVNFTHEFELPPSLNFVIGLNPTLRWMNFLLTNEHEVEIPVGNVTDQEFPLEVLDLLGHLRTAVSTTILNLYRSNVWIVFPKLLVIAVTLIQTRNLPVNAEVEANVGNIGEQAAASVTHYWEFTRDVYEKIQLARN